MSIDDSKICPYCAESIKAAAIKCRYCGSELAGPPPRVPPAAVVRRPGSSPWIVVTAVTAVAVMVVLGVVILWLGRDDADSGRSGDLAAAHEKCPGSELANEGTVLTAHGSDASCVLDALAAPGEVQESWGAWADALPGDGVDVSPIEQDGLRYDFIVDSISMLNNGIFIETVG